MLHCEHLYCGPMRKNPLIGQTPYRQYSSRAWYLLSAHSSCWTGKDFAIAPDSPDSHSVLTDVRDLRPLWYLTRHASAQLPSQPLPVVCRRTLLKPAAMATGTDAPSPKVLGVARRTLGIALLLLVVFLWTASNFLGSVRSTLLQRHLVSPYNEY